MSAVVSRARRAAWLACLASLGFVALSSATPARAADPISVDVTDYTFTPHAISARDGDTVQFRNLGAVDHRIVADDGSFDSGDLAAGTGFSTVIDAAGEIRVHCSIHPSMTATITVAVADPTAPAPAAASSTSSTRALPNQLAETGVGDIAPFVGACASILVGSIALALHRRRQLELALLPAEHAWHAVTVGQRHHDDIISGRT